MCEKDKTLQILKEFENSYEEARSYIFKHIGDDDTWKTKSQRNGDWFTQHDRDIYNIYQQFAKNYNMLVLSEEDWDQIEKENAYRFDYLLILDSIDGTVNLMSNLLSGVNMAFGPIKKDQSDFRIGDIKGVFVTDYLNRKSFRWHYGGKPSIFPPKYDGEEFKKSEHEHALIYELPDEASYALKNNINGIKKQEELLKIFKVLFKGIQRRAIDCTGLRMLEVSDKQLVAYGDLRGVTRIWDTIPSIKFLLECDKEFIILGHNFQKYSDDTVILYNDGKGNFSFNNDIGKNVIVLRKRDYFKLLKYQSQEKDISDTKLNNSEQNNAKAVVHYNFQGDNPIININSQDFSINVDESKIIFNEIKKTIERQLTDLELRDKLLKKLDELDNTKNKKEFNKNYAEFIQLAANHMTILAPFIPALTEFFA